MESKLCTLCKMEKTATCFSTRDVGRSLRSACKECENKRYLEKYREAAVARSKQRYAENAEAERLRSSIKYAANRDYYLDKNKNWAIDNRERYLELKRNRYAKNSEKLAEQSKAAYAANRDEIRARRKTERVANHELRARERAYYDANKDRYAERQREALAEFPEKFSARRHARRALQYSAAGSHTAEQILELMEKQRGKCACCRVDIRGNYHKDHITALARGGSNDITNIQLLCPKCNLSKNAKDPVDFMRERGFLI